MRDALDRLARLAIRVLDEHGAGSCADVALGVLDAADQGARVIQIAIGCPRDEPALRLAAPFASAAAAYRLASEPELSPGGLQARLLEDARDVGPAGHDRLHGSGLVSFR